MSDYKQARDQVLELEEGLRDMPQEVRNVLHPVRLTGKEHFQFRCHPGIACFNACCRNIEIILTPYDLIRIRRRLNLDAESFLYHYATPFTLTKGQLPVPLIRMDPETGQCPFNGPDGCSIYSDRPVACRYYPIGMALMHKQETKDDDEFYFLIKEEFCHGHREVKDWTIQDWRSDQGSDGYDVQNRGWMEFILKRRSAGDGVATAVQLSEFFYMASTNPDVFRRFVFDSSFLKKFHVDPETERLIREDDQALTDFAFSWLKSILFGDAEVKVKPTAVAELKERRANKTVAKENLED
ncbi:MAG: YkgJ family cysteine cluster protein [Magnetococcales bacterium]|nr:YkgJ family cysteine cluster protein [Magnetococcales bacterium]HIJ85841.1 YkgJ family cysteine cluster protein [Magnetococcales bacterium]